MILIIDQMETLLFALRMHLSYAQYRTQVIAHICFIIIATLFFDEW